MTIVLFGSEGMLGAEFNHYFKYKNRSVSALDFKQCDITDKMSCRTVLSQGNVTLVINCAAFTQVDDCENQQEKAYSVNALAVENIAELCSEFDIPLIHFSTDYVFDGKKNTAYCEDDSCNPLNYYGFTKYQSEQYIQTHCKKYYIFRIQWVYGEWGNHFIKTMLSLAAVKDAIDVVDDQIGTPTWTKSIVYQVMKAVELNCEYGIYHLRDNGTCSWYQYASLLISGLNLDLVINPIQSSLFKRPAERPLNGVLDTLKLRQAIDFQPDSWQDQVNKFLGVF